MSSSVTPLTDRSTRARSAHEERLYEIWGELRDLGSIQELVEWDQETYMPERGQSTRGSMCGTLAALRHRLMVSEELWETLGACAEEAQPGSDLEAQVRVARQDVERARRLPESLARALAEAKSRGTSAWQKARAADDFSLFEKELAELLLLTREEAATVAPGGNPYDALVDKFEPGATEEELVPLFEHLEKELVPLVRAVVESGRPVDESPVRGHFAPDRQEALARHAAEGIGFDFAAGRLDRTAHPFCVGLSPNDVRLTWRWQEDDLRPALYGVLHEAGHGLYEQGLPADWQRTPLGDSVSLGIHESQSRLFENQVGRSRGFWTWLWPKFQELFPEHAASTDIDALWPALHTVKPSLIRVEADEGTYNLHVAIRFRLERALFAGDLDVPDLPGAWDDLYEELLGIRAPSVADGVLQDIHWSQGIFGYFPTYTLGTMNAAQLYAAAQQDLGDLEAQFAEGETGRLLEWMREKVHRWGCRYTAGELIEKATGRPRSADDLLAYLRQTTEEVYGIG